MSYEEDDHIKISETEDSEFMEFPKEDDNTVLLSSIQAQFPNAIGLKYRGSSGAWRALRAVDNVLDAPKDGWGDAVYCLTINETLKRKTNEDSGVSRKKGRLNPLLQDMAVMNLPFQITTDELKEYFQTNYGDVSYCEVKTHRDTKRSRGYGFIRFKDELAAKDAVSAEHHIHGRKVEVKPKQKKPMKLFVGRLPDGTTKTELKEHFSAFGELSDVYIPSPFRNFAFITYSSEEEGKEALADNHSLHGSRLNVMERTQDNKDKKPIKEERSERGRSTSDRFSDGNSREKRSSYNTASEGTASSLDANLKNLLFQYLSSH